MASVPVAPPPTHDPAAPDVGAPQELRAWLKTRREDLAARYFKRPDPQQTLRANADLVDQLLRQLWSRAIADPEVALVAVGGYGRGALFPHSDVDLLVLLPDGETPGAAVEKLIGALWDSGLEPGSSVRTVSECVEEAAKDVTVDTSLMEARHVAGNASL